MTPFHKLFFIPIILPSEKAMVPPLQYSCLENHGRRSLVGCSPWGRVELDTTERLHFHFSLHALEKEMAIHSSVLAWRIPGMAKPGGLLSMGSHRVGHDRSDLAAAAASGSDGLYFSQLPRQCWYCWSWGHTLRPTAHFLHLAVKRSLGYSQFTAVTNNATTCSKANAKIGRAHV